jgi:hypothetical protein
VPRPDLVSAAPDRSIKISRCDLGEETAFQPEVGEGECSA